MRDVIWHGDTRGVVRSFPEQARKDIGAELMLLQLNETPVHARPMTSVGRGVWEIKIQDDRKQYRIFYIVKRHGPIHVLHAFEKKSRRTSKEDIVLARKRLKEVSR